MRTAIDNIKIIGQTRSIDELNAAYNEAILEAERLNSEGAFGDSEQSISSVIATLNHLTNYNIVRVANMAYEGYEASGRTDNNCLIEISRCRDSIKEHEDNKDEIELLDGLCSELEIQ